MLSLNLSIFWMCMNSTSNVKLNVDHDSCKQYLHKEYYGNDDSFFSRSRTWIENLSQQIPNDKLPINIMRLLFLYDKIITSCTNISITVLGGSLTAGRNAGGFSGAWPNQLGKMLQSYRQEKYSSGACDRNGRVDILNRGLYATNSLWALHSLESLIPFNTDLVIVDYDVNDCANMGRDNESYNYIWTLTEVMIRRLAHRAHPPAILFMNIASQHAGNREYIYPDCQTFHSCYSIGEVRLPVLDAYYVPMVSAKLAFWHNFTCPPPREIWSCEKFCYHPKSSTHKLLAQVVFHFLSDIPKHLHLSLPQNSLLGDRDIHNISRTFSREVLDMPANPLVEQTAYYESQLCHGHRTIVNSPDSVSVLLTNSSTSPQTPRNYSCWNYTEDVPGKWGWVSYDCFNSSMYLVMSFGSTPKLTLTALTTYPLNTGAILVSIGDLPMEYEARNNTSHASLPSALNLSSVTYHSIGHIDGLTVSGEWERLSLASSFTFITTNIYLPDMYYVPPEILRANSTLIVRLSQIDANSMFAGKKRAHITRIYPQKFKLISIRSC